NRIVSALGDNDPEHHLHLIPQNLDGKEHVACRHVVNPWFSPGSIRRIDDLARDRCIEMIEELQPRGACDLAKDFAMIYPTEIFLALLGLPMEDGAAMLPHVEAVFGGFFGGHQDAGAGCADGISAYRADE